MKLLFFFHLLEKMLKLNFFIKMKHFCVNGKNDSENIDKQKAIKKNNEEEKKVPSS